MPRMTSAAAEEEETTPLVSVSSLLGPAYDEAVQIAQYAIDNERNSHVHTAIDAYIRAGQMLISIGRQQHTAHLQNMYAVPVPVRRLTHVGVLCADCFVMLQL